VTPATKEEFAKIAECYTKIQHLEESIREIKEELRNLRGERTESQQYISNRKLAIYLTIASILGGFLVKIFEWLLQSVT